MQQDLAELTVAAVENVYGPLTACVYSILAYHGRQSLHGLVKHSRLPLRQIKPSLVILVQYHMVIYDTDDTARTCYTAKGETAYNMVFRFGKFAVMVQDQWGDNAAYIFRKIATLGQATIKHLVTEFGKDKSNSIPTHELRRIVHDFLKHGYLSAVTKHNFQPQHLYEAEVEKEILVQFHGPPKGKDKPIADGLRIQIRRRMRDEAFYCLEEEEPPTKRRKLSKPITNGIKKPLTEVQEIHHDSDPISSATDDLLFIINFEKCLVLMRNQQLTRLAHRYAGDTSAKLFEALVHSLDGYIFRCYDPYERPSNLLSTQEPDLFPRISSTIPTIIEHLDPPDIDLNQGLPGGIVSNGVNGHNKSTDAQLKRKYADEIRAARAKSHLDLLARINPKFVNLQSSTTWNVPFKNLTRELIQEEIENTITARLGPVATRIIRILHRNFSSDEKFLAHEAILKPKEVRATTNALIAAGLVSTHEIPRDVNRTTNRLLWLYAYDSARARKALLMDSYRTMLRLLKRIESEQKNIQALIDKSERADVVGKEKELLSADELSRLEHFAVVEKGILAHIGRVDDLVACLRDFAPIDDPHVGNRRRAGNDESPDGAIVVDDD